MKNAKREKELRTLTLSVGGAAGVTVAFAVVMFIANMIELSSTAGVVALLLIALAVILYILAERADRAFQREMRDL